MTFVVTYHAPDGSPMDGSIQARDWRIDPTGALLLFDGERLAMAYAPSVWIFFSQQNY